MKKLSKKSVLLFAAVMAVCAFAMPSMASAASWVGPFPSTHIFDASNPANRLSFSAPALGAGLTCSVVQFHIDILSALDARVTGATFQNCMGTGAAVNCTITFTATKLPWTITNPTTTNVTVDGVHLDEFFENTPGNGTQCAFLGANFTLTGNLNGGSWSNPSHELTFTNATGLTAHTLSSGPLAGTLSGTFADTSGNLTMAD